MLPCNGSEGEGTLNAHKQIIRNSSKEGNWDGKELDKIYGIASSGERQGRRGPRGENAARPTEPSWKYGAPVASCQQGGGDPKGPK